MCTGTKDNLFINLKEGLFSFTPVCHLAQLRFILVSPLELNCAKSLIAHFSAQEQTKIKPNMKDLNKLINSVQAQIKEHEKLRLLRQEIDPNIQQLMARCNELQAELKEQTRKVVQESNDFRDLLQSRNLVTACSDEISLLTQIAKQEFQVEPSEEYEE